MEVRSQPTSLRTFLIIWGGQLVSILGSEMTNFAVTIWAWELTGRATTLSLIFLFSRLPRVIAATFAGVLVDRSNRKQLMLLGDTVAGASTLALLMLFLTDNLFIWHLYVTSALNALFGYFQSLSYSSSMSALVPKRHYTRATAMGSMQIFGANITAPALAGVLYYAIGFAGILLIDLATFLIAISTLIAVTIPQPIKSEAEDEREAKIWRQLTFGCRYIVRQPSLLAILIFLLSSNLFSSASFAIAFTMILARSGDNAAVLASVQSALGLGGLVGAVVLSVWGGFKRRIHGLLLGFAMKSLCQIFLALGRIPLAWIGAAFGAAFFFPFTGSSNQAIWLSKVEPEVQGRVFATRYLLAQITTPIGAAIAGPLADRFFEPAMRSGGTLAEMFGGIFGTGAGAGMALEYALFSSCGLAIALMGYAFPVLRDVEARVPDRDPSAVS